MSIWKTTFLSVFVIPSYEIPNYSQLLLFDHCGRIAEVSETFWWHCSLCSAQQPKWWIHLYIFSCQSDALESKFSITIFILHQVFRITYLFVISRRRRKRSGIWDIPNERTVLGYRYTGWKPVTLDFFWDWFHSDKKGKLGKIGI